MIIAEISQNFTCLGEAKVLVWLAKENGADLAKAQLFDSMKLYGKKVPAELSFEDAKELFDYGASIGIEVFFSVFDIERVRWCEKIGVKRYKIASSYRGNAIQAIAETGKPMIISYSFEHDQYFQDQIINQQALFCVSLYPAPITYLRFGKVDFGYWAGFSDHTLNLTASKVAISRGAKIIERHFCFRHDYGIDAQWSMTPGELRELRIFYDEAQKCL